MNHEADLNSVPDFTEDLFPYAMEQRAKVTRAGTRFVHYTSASVAKSILERREVWMRRSSVMNDFSEIEYGLECLNFALQGDAGQRLSAALDLAHPGILEEAKRFFESRLPGLRNGTYLTCISEHAASEDLLGRLSMWRAYGGTSGVALVLNPKVFLAPSTALRAYSSPVFYGTREEFAGQLDLLAQRAREMSTALASADRNEIGDRLFNVLLFAALCTKHPGFHEEREWRVVQTVSFGLSEHLRLDIEDVGGIPQHVTKIPLRNVPDEGFFGAKPNELIERIIIGPTAHPDVLWGSFVALLEKAGVQNAASKVVVSNIPLRR